MYAIFWLIYTVLSIYSWFLIAYVILSWLTAFGVINSYQPFVQSVSHFLQSVIEPLAAPIRRTIHRLIPNLGGIDLSVLVLWLLVKFVEIFIRTSVQPIFLGP